MTILLRFVLLLSCFQVIWGHIYIVSGESNSPDRFVWLPSTKNKNVFKVSNDGQNYGTRKANEKSPKEIENDQKVLQYLFDTNNNHDDRHINFRRRF